MKIHNILVSLESLRLQHFSIRVGNTSDPEEHTECGYHYDPIQAGGNVTFDCNSVARFVSLNKERGFDKGSVTICEFVVIGYPLRTQGEVLISWRDFPYP